ncbi:hypothetical protein M0R04_08435 [Candidatus Dojkabacteria bacterium]|jgi:DNA-binding NarL/FixJ family response regulator|nr:hypothetical protein [Candidatus Dojkabacteria bacterium]
MTTKTPEKTIEILKLVAEGNTEIEVGEIVHLSQSGVKSRIARAIDEHKAVNTMNLVYKLTKEGVL